ncbi:hypothetical protein NGRA_1084 [Nosema granulosis]|uniref:Cdc37 N-terminal domain-containing protein n=1 Tax=Nosema granulosis TaxID=83296 RepID=A0A9P6GZP0_9MICR|nr:hypothetical protein NGRA_1084 [Nosema granulosis]
MSKQQIEEIEVSDSSSEVHPNIDKKSYKNWKRQMAANHKKELKARYEELSKKDALEEDEKQEMEKLQHLLTPKYVSVNEGGFRVSKEDNNYDQDYVDELLEMLRDSSLENFISVVSSNKIDLNVFEDYVLYNLSENIKEGNDDVGFKLSKISLFLGYVKNNGSLLVSRLCDELKNPEKLELFENDVKKYYDASKNAILNLRK